jgi:hypothetical protein
MPITILACLVLAGCGGSSKPALSRASSTQQPKQSGQPLTRRSAVASCERSQQKSDTGVSVTFGDKKARLEELGAPAIVDARGSDVEVLFIDRRDNYMRDCMYAADGWTLIVPGPLSSYPAVQYPNGIDDDYSTDLTADCVHPAQGADEVFSEEFGRVGADISAVTFEFAHAAPVHATIRHGFYEAWWNWLGDPNAVTLKTLSGNVISSPIQGTYPSPNAPC